MKVKLKKFLEKRAVMLENYENHYSDNFKDGSHHPRLIYEVTDDGYVHSACLLTVKGNSHCYWEVTHREQIINKEGNLRGEWFYFTYAFAKKG